MNNIQQWMLTDLLFFKLETTVFSSWCECYISIVEFLSHSILILSYSRFLWLYPISSSVLHLPVCLWCFPLDVTSDGEKLRFCQLFFSLSSSLWFHSDSAFVGWKLINSYFTLDNLPKTPESLDIFPSFPLSLSLFLYVILILLFFYPSGRSGFHPRLMKKTVSDALNGLWFLLYRHQHSFPESLQVQTNNQHSCLTFTSCGADPASRFTEWRALYFDVSG